MTIKGISSESYKLYRRKMTRSAPPERSSGAHNTSVPGRNASRQRRHPPSTMPSISIEDIYRTAERERLNYSSCSRRQNLAHAQSQTQFFRHEQSAFMSRPNTSVSREPNSGRRDATTPMSAWSEPIISRPSSIIPHPDLHGLLENGEDSDDEDIMAHHGTPLSVSISPVTRDCCEIIGPQLCYECRKNRIREVSRQRSDIYFPVLEPTEDHVTTAAICRKYLPELSEPEIETKIARGEIARPSMFRKQAKQLEFSDEEVDAKPKFTNKKVTIVDHNSVRSKSQTDLTRRQPNELFFTNIRDLNNKIVKGNVERNVGFSNAVKQVIKTTRTQHAVKNMYPAFVSPRKVVLLKETNYKTFFDPPLIAKEKQSSEPSFFAGSSGEYKLPDKLPDDLVFVDKDGNEVSASSAAGLTNRLAMVDEVPTAKVERVTIAPAGVGDLGCLEEGEEEEEEAPLQSDTDETVKVSETSESIGDPSDTISS
ncbi:uncharacterized protein LOC128239131 isoform X2 [Mya arenaria]|uniref:uncharacterized protein LOC128239131 isoform X2 n=1 Tax=Mya arenaria TaxID=6604 RepID=UPI0022E2AC58|nr:uncharacterized protein LOC128239131 isoform X2 [Mya arenaria]